MIKQTKNSAYQRKLETGSLAPARSSPSLLEAPNREEKGKTVAVKKQTVPDAPSRTARSGRSGQDIPKKKTATARPSAASKGSGRTGSSDAHLTMSQVAAANPMASRYLNFGRLIFMAMEQGVSKEKFHVLCESFYIEETLRKSSSKEEKKKQKATESKVPSLPEKKEVPDGLIKQAMQVLPSFVTPNRVGSGLDSKKISYPDQGKRDRSDYKSRQRFLGQLTSANLGVLSRVLENCADDRAYLNAPEYRTSIRERIAHSKDGDEGETPFAAFALNDEDRKKYLDDFFSKVFFLEEWGGTVVALKQFYMLQKDMKLLSDPHLKATLRLFKSLSDIPAPSAEDSWPADDLKVVAERTGVTVEQLKSEMGTPQWKGSQNLGRCHPRVLALQIDDLKKKGHEERYQEFRGLYLEAFTTLTIDGGGRHEIKPYWRVLLSQEKSHGTSRRNSEVGESQQPSNPDPEGSAARVDDSADKRKTPLPSLMGKDRRQFGGGRGTIAKCVPSNTSRSEPKAGIAKEHSSSSG